MTYFQTTSQPAGYRVATGAFGPGITNVFTLGPGSNFDLYDVAMGMNGACPAGVTMSDTGVNNPNILTIFNAEDAKEIHVWDWLPASQPTLAVIINNPCPGVAGYYKVGYVSHNIFNNAPNFPFSPSSLATTTIDLSTSTIAQISSGGASSSQMFAGGFSYGEIISTMFLFLIFAISLYSFFFNWLRGTKIKA